MSEASFRTIETSNPRFEVEGLRHVTVKSPALKMRADITLWIPDPLPEKVHLAILLHGVYGSHWAWAFSGGAHRTTQRLITSGKIPPMILAMPSDGLWGDGSGYVPHKEKDFERWIVEDVPTAASAVVGAKRLKKKFFLCGLSMGGFGALRLGAKYGDRCAAVSAHSSITEFPQMSSFVEEDLAHYGASAKKESVLSTILANRSKLPPLRFDCGRSDSLLEDNRALHDNLEKEGIKHVYAEFAGGHDWAYWGKHLENSLWFFARHAK